MAYQLTIRSVLDHAAPVWDDCGDRMSQDVESVQHRCLARALGVNYRSHATDVCVEAGHPPLLIRRRVQLLRYWIRLNSHHSPLVAHLATLPHSFRLQEVRRSSFWERLHSLCSSLNLTVQQAAFLSSTDLEQITLHLWEIHNRAVRLDRPDDRRRHYASLQTTLSPHPVLNSSLPRASKSIFHGLRLGTAPLQQFLSSIECAPSPECSCGEGEESVDHFLLRCRRFDPQRLVLQNKLDNLLGPLPLTTELLLGNDPTRPKKILLKIARFVCVFVASTHRFTRRRPHLHRRAPRNLL